MSRRGRPSGRERREALAKARRRKKRIRASLWTVGALAVAATLGAFVLAGPDSGEETAAVAPDFELSEVDGEPISLGEYRGRPVALTFMHTW